MPDEKETKLSIFQGLSSATGKLIGQKLSADAIRLARREAVWELRCMGYTQTYIGDTLGVTQATISRDLKWCFKTHTDTLMNDVGRVQAEQLGVLEYVRQEALEAWRLSKEEAMEVARKSLQAQSGTGQGGTAQTGTVVKPLEQTTKVKSQTGHVPYLAEARAAMSDIRKIVGADRPKKIALTDPSGDNEAASQTGLVIVIPSRMTIADVIDEPEEDDTVSEPGPDSGA